MLAGETETCMVEKNFEKLGPSLIPNEITSGKFKATLYGFENGERYFALEFGKLSEERPLVRLASACLLAHVFSSQRCDCVFQLREAMGFLHERGGLLVYGVDDHANGAGLEASMKTYALADNGMDPYTALQHLGFEADQREYAATAAILRDYRIEKVRLVTNNPRKLRELVKHGIDCERVALKQSPMNEHNRLSLQGKKKLGHLVEL